MALHRPLSSKSYARISSHREQTKTEHSADLSLLLSKMPHDEACSVDVPAALQELTTAIRKEDPSGHFVKMTPQQAVEWLRENNGEAGGQFTQFLNQHGHRGIGEMLMYHKSWDQEPTMLIPSLQAMLRASEMPNNAANTVVDVDAAVAMLKSPTTIVGRWLLRRIVPRARRAAGNRECSKASLVRMAHFLKKGFWKLASIMKEEGRLPDEDLLFYFKDSELDTLLKTRSAKLIARAQRRRRISSLQEKFDFPLLSKGYPVPIVESNVSADSNTQVSLKIQGTPVSRGSIRGTARVIHSVDQAHTIEAGDILVVQTTDVGWSPYFPLLSGLVTEIGGMLSHGVVLTREYGIPCVVNIPKATAIFKSGDILVLNGSQGTVERLDQLQ